MKTFPIRTDKNLTAAETFLDMFGLTFDRDDSFYYGDSTPIIDNTGDVVGRLKYGCDEIVIEVKTPLGPMSASFPDIRGHSFYMDSPTIYFKTTVSYKISLTKNETLDGECTLDFTKFDFGDLEVKVSHKFYLLNGNAVRMRIEVGNRKFKAHMENSHIIKDILLDLNPTSTEYLIHKEYIYSIYGRISNYQSIKTSDKDATKMRVFCETYRDGVLQEETEEFVDKVCPQDKGSKEDDSFIMQLCTLMHEIDPSLIKLTGLRNSLNNGTTNLLDEILNTSLTGFTDNELEALFGFIPKLEREQEKRYTFLPNQNR